MPRTEMPRRSGRKADTETLEIDSTITTITAKKRGRSIKVEAEEISASVSRPPPAKRSRKNIKEEAGSDNDSLATDLPGHIKASRVKVEKGEETQTPKQGLAKHTPEADDEDVEEKKPSKKRKTKEEKAAEAMPLAARAAVGTLKHAMHVGAHVSGAGGNSP